MRSKMELVLEELAHVFTDETTAAMTGPYSTPLGKGSEGEVKSTAAPTVPDPEGSAPLGKGKPEPGGDTSFYDKEGKKSDYPYAKPGKTTEADGDIPKIPDPEGKAPLGKGTEQKGGESDAYEDEKEKAKYPFKFDEKKAGAKTEEDDPLAELEKLQKMAEEVPFPTEIGDPAVEEPAADPGAEPALEEPEETEWEIYAHSGDFDLISDRAMEVLKPIVEDPKVAITVKFFGDEGKKNAVVDALAGSGFVVLGVEKEGESDEVVSAPAADVTGAAPEEPEAAAGPEIMAEWKRKKRRSIFRNLLPLRINT